MGSGTRAESKKSDYRSAARAIRPPFFFSGGFNGAALPWLEDVQSDRPVLIYVTRPVSSSLGPEAQRLVQCLREQSVHFPQPIRSCVHQVDDSAWTDADRYREHIRRGSG